MNQRSWSTSLAGDVAVITGASRGIGAAIAHAAAQAGAKVVLAARKIEALEETAEAIRQSGGQALAVACHTGKADQVEALFRKANETFGAVNQVVNNAATNPHFGPMLSIDDGAFLKTFEVNVKGYLEVIRQFAKQHKVVNGKTGSVVNIASIAAIRAAPMQGTYGMTKAAVVSMTKTLAVELAPSGIRVNAIAPGLVETKFASAIVKNQTLRDMVVGKTPLARHAQPEEIAASAVYLMSGGSSFTTGSVMVNDGGFTIQ